MEKYLTIEGEKKEGQITPDQNPSLELFHLQVLSQLDAAEICSRKVTAETFWCPNIPNKFSLIPELGYNIY